MTPLILLLKRYISVILTIYLVLIALRLFESSFIFYYYGFSTSIALSEIKGLIYDILAASVFIVPYFILYFLISKINNKLLKFINLTLLISFSIVAFLIIKFFLYQLIPLDIFLYSYSFHEVLFTIKTSDSNLVLLLISILLLIVSILFICRRLNSIKFTSFAVKLTSIFVGISFLFFLVIYSFNLIQTDKFSLHKPYYFISQSINYLLKKESNTAASDVEKFHQIYPNKKYIDNSYPLLHPSNYESKLSQYFHKFDSLPNIVVLIVEGLNDDFIHPYHQASLMPFLSQLKDRSLYWNRCFTLGERSFAAVPSIMGALPYGEKGFMQEERLPLHLSLVSTLKSNGYFTSFFYGQGAWFHRKNRFFKHNDIDLIFDNSNFSKKYEKIIVGNDHFFWGYHDKDLFNQSFEVLDSIHQNKRLDIYFTGTSHSPYRIDDEELYSKKLNSIKNKANESFFDTYAKYLKSVLFVDDAIKMFFETYKKRADYENTIFIITGDHPMTEIPIKNSLKRYHVPLIIYSEKLKKAAVFTNTVSHLDIYESIISILKNQLKNIPTYSTSLGSQLLPNTTEVKKIAFMNDNREVIDFLSANYYLSNNKLYKVDSELNIEEINNKTKWSEMNYQLEAFRNTNQFVCRENKIIPPELYCQALQHQLIYFKNSRDTIQSSQEYFELVSDTLISNQEFTFDISLLLTSKHFENISLVYQITDSKDSLLIWKNFGLNNEEYTQYHIAINDLKNYPDTQLYFKSYLWNTNKVEFEIKNREILLYR